MIGQKLRCRGNGVVTCGGELNMMKGYDAVEVTSALEAHLNENQDHFISAGYCYDVSDPNEPETNEL